MSKWIFSFFLFLMLINNTATAQTPTFEWVKQFGGSGSDYCYDIILDDAGNIFCTGAFVGTVDFDPGPGVTNLTSAGQSIFITKLNPNGDLIWAKAFQGVTYNAGASLTLDSTSNNEIYVTGIFSGTVDFDPSIGSYNLTSVGGSNDVFVCKLDAFGNLIWVKQIGSAEIESVGSIEIDFNNGGDICISGSYSGTTDFDPGPGVYNLSSVGTDNSLFVCKLSSIGDFVWAKRIAGTGQKQNRELAIDSSGNIYMVGWFYGTVDFNPDTNTQLLLSSTHQDIYLLKLNFSGDLAWVKQIGGAGWDTGTAMDVQADQNGDIVISGNFQNTVDFDPGPNTNNLTSFADYDVFVGKYSTNGDFIWAKRLGGISIDKSFNTVFDDDGNVFTTGHFRGYSDWDPNPLVTFSMTSVGNDDIFISKLDPNGDFLWAKSMGGSGPDAGLKLATNDLGNLFVSGAFFSPSIDFDHIQLTNINPSGSSEVFIAKINKFASLEEGISIPKNIKLYPNPATETIYIDKPINGELFNITILNLKGQIVKHFKLKSNEIPVADLPKGMYFLRIENKERSITQKFVKD